MVGEEEELGRGFEKEGQIVFDRPVDPKKKQAIADIEPPKKIKQAGNVQLHFFFLFFVSIINASCSLVT